MANFSLLAKIGVDSKALQTGLAKAKKSVKGFGDSIGGLGGLIAAAGLKSLAMSAINTGSRISDLSEQLRINAESLQALQVAAEKAGVSQSSLERSLRNLIIRTQEAKDGNLTYGDAFERLGLNIEKFSKLPTEKKLVAVSKAFERAGKSQEAFADVANILGQRAGPELMEILRRLADEGLDKITESAKRMGQVMDEDVVQQMDELADNIAVLKRFSVTAFATVINGAIDAATAVGVFLLSFTDNKLFREYIQQTKDAKIHQDAFSEALAKSTDKTDEYNNVIDDSISENFKAEEAAEALAKALKKERDALKEAKGEMDEYIKGTKDVTEAQMERFIRQKELESLMLRSQGQSAESDRLDEYINKVKEALDLTNRYGIAIQDSVRLVKGLDSEQAKASAVGAEGQDLEKVASAIGEKAGVSFKETSEGMFQQFVDGIETGTKFTEEQLQEGIRKQIESSKDQSKILNQIKDVLGGKFTNQ